MNGINKVILFGRIGAAPELKHLPSGKAYCRMGFATSHSVRRQDTWQEETEWHNVVAWDHQAELVCRYLGRGALCIVEGRLHSHSYDDASGVRRRAVDVVAERVTFLPDSNRKTAREEHPPVATDLPVPEEPIEEEGVCAPASVTEVQPEF